MNVRIRFQKHGISCLAMPPLIRPSYSLYSQLSPADRPPHQCCHTDALKSSSSINQQMSQVLARKAT